MTKIFIDSFIIMPKYLKNLTSSSNFFESHLMIKKQLGQNIIIYCNTNV